jgi:hypothetical protein
VEALLDGSVLGTIAILHWAEKVMVLTDSLEMAVEITFRTKAF